MLSCSLSASEIHQEMSPSLVHNMHVLKKKKKGRKSATKEMQNQGKNMAANVDSGNICLVIAVEFTIRKAY